VGRRAEARWRGGLGLKVGGRYRRLGVNPQSGSFPRLVRLTVTGLQLGSDGIRITLIDQLAACAALAHSRGWAGNLSGVGSLAGVRLEGERDEINWAVVFTRCDRGNAFGHGTAGACSGPGEQRVCECGADVCQRVLWMLISARCEYGDWVRLVGCVRKKFGRSMPGGGTYSRIKSAL